MARKPNKAFLIDSINRTITEVVIKDYKEISERIGCDLFTCVGVENNDTIYVDDEGLLKPCEAFFLYKGYNQPLAGNGLLMGSDEEGESTDPKMTLEELKSKVKFMGRTEAYNWAVLYEKGLIK